MESFLLQISDLNLLARQSDAEIIAALNQTVEKHPRWGFWKCYDYLRLNGHGWNHKRVLRVYRQLKLNLPRRVKRRIQRERVPLEIVAEVNASWSLDFMYDSLYCGKRFRTLNVIDEGVRECLAIEVDTSLRAERVVKVLERLKGWHGTPRMIRLDNGPELTSVQLQAWCESNSVELRFIQPILTPMIPSSTRLMTCLRSLMMRSKR